MLKLNGLVNPFFSVLSVLQVTDARSLGSDLTVLSCLFASFGVTICVQGLSYTLWLFSWEYVMVSSIE